MAKIVYDANVPENHNLEAPVPQCPVCKDGTAHVICKDGKIRFSALPDTFDEWLDVMEKESK